MRDESRRSARSRIVAITPLLQRYQSNAKFASLRGEFIGAAASGAVRPTFQDTFGDQAVKPRAEDVPGQPEAGVEVVEPA